MSHLRKTAFVLCTSLMCLLSTVALAQPSVADYQAAVRQLWQLLDYIAVDYEGAVSAGQIINEIEYAEMRDFTRRATDGLKALPASPERQELVDLSKDLVAAVDAKLDPAEISSTALALADRLLQAYPIPAVPLSTPDLQLGSTLYQEQCVSCHGVSGAGDGPLAAGLDPPPIAFTDPDRASSRSPLALYQATSLGVPGTSMPPFDQLSEQERWALAYYVSTLSNDPAMRAEGETLWQADASRFGLTDLTQLTAESERSLAQRVGPDEARDVLAYLRAHPQAVLSETSGSTALARERLQESLEAMRGGDESLAIRLALSSYLDGFEPLEPRLLIQNSKMMHEVENGMLAYRGALTKGDTAEAERLGKELSRLLLRVEQELDTSGANSNWSTFLGSFTILLREGLEALLVIAGMMAFLKKAERTDALPYVHIGWIAALAAGVLTWVVATYFVSISGASREMTEGISSLFAAVVLLGVGLWMHHKSSAGRWQAYIKTKLSSAMSKRTGIALFTLAFVAVYREVFETVLFYSALWVEGNGQALLAGLVAGALVLSVLTWVILKTSARMPIGKFFSISSIVVAILAVVLTGKGISALQEAGVVAATLFSGPRINVLGIYPTVESVVAQIAVALFALLGFAVNAVGHRQLQTANPH